MVCSWHSISRLATLTITYYNIMIVTNESPVTRKWNYEICISQTSLISTEFIVNINNICVSNYVY